MGTFLARQVLNRLIPPLEIKEDRSEGLVQKIVHRIKGEARLKVHIAYCLLICQPGSETPRADLHFFCPAFYLNPHALKVWIPASFGLIVGVTYIVA